MSTWTRYHWFDLPEDELPWTGATEEPVMPKPMELTGDADPTFDPDHTYFARLSRDWNGHRAGARVIITPSVVVIERDDPMVGADPAPTLQASGAA